MTTGKTVATRLVSLMAAIVIPVVIVDVILALVFGRASYTSFWSLIVVELLYFVIGVVSSMVSAGFRRGPTWAWAVGLVAGTLAVGVLAAGILRKFGLLFYFPDFVAIFPVIIVAVFVYSRIVVPSRQFMPPQSTFPFIRPPVIAVFCVLNVMTLNTFSYFYANLDLFVGLMVFGGGSLVLGIVALSYKGDTLGVTFSSPYRSSLNRSTVIAVGLGLFVLGIALVGVGSSLTVFATAGSSRGFGIGLTALGWLLCVTGIGIFPSQLSTRMSQASRTLHDYVFIILLMSGTAILSVAVTIFGIGFTWLSERRGSLALFAFYEGIPFLVCAILLSVPAFGLLRLQRGAWWVAIVGSLGAFAYGFYRYYLSPLVPPWGGDTPWFSSNPAGLVTMALGAIVLAHLLGLFRLLQRRKPTTGGVA